MDFAPTESRVKKTLLNARVNLIFYFLTLVLSFFSRKIFLNCLGADFVGLTGTLQNLLGFLNLAELGIGSAIGYVLYKPLFDKDRTKINEIISVMGYLYRWIGLIILCGGIILSLFLPLIFPDSGTGFQLPLIYSAYYAFLASSLIGYFINYRQNLLGADQRNYVVTAYFQSMNIGKTIIQMALAYYTGSYYLWIIIELVFGIIYSFILNWKINQTYPWLKTEVSKGRQLLKAHNLVLAKTRQLFIHRISSFIQYQTTPFLTYAFVSLQTVAYLGNYTLILDKLIALMDTVLGSASAGVGNLIAENNQTKIYNVFWEYTTLSAYLGGIILFICLTCINPLIDVWLGSQYIMPSIVIILLSGKIYLQICIGSIGPFLYGYGLFRDVWSAITQAVIFILIAIIGGYYYQLSGILFAGFISILIIPGIWKPYYLFKNGFKLKINLYWRNWLWLNAGNLLILAITFFVVHHLNTINYKTSFLYWLMYSSINTLLYVVISALLYYQLYSSFKRLLKRILNLKKL